jgi:hypothetical chaperone protein
MSRACGVDFGTSNSTVGCYQESTVKLLNLEDGKPTLPSVIFFNTDLDETSFGRTALASYLEGYEGRLMRSMKSLLGTSLIEGQTEVQGRRLPYKDLLAQYIGELKHRGELAIGGSFQHAVFGRPVHFIDDDLAADRLAEQTLREIAQAIGFKEIAFQYEPIAAALDYESRLSREELVLIVDIGGGTSDFSIVRLSPERRKNVERHSDILSNAGVHIGGTDFDKYLSLNHFMPLLGMGGRLRNDAEMPSANYFNLATWHTINLVYSQKVIREIQDICRDVTSTDLRNQCESLLNLIEQRDGHWLALKSEEVKINLTSQETTSILLERLRANRIGNLAQTIAISNCDFQSDIKHLLEQICATVAAVLIDANISSGQIDTVFFTGGASGVRGLRQYLSQMLPNARQVDGDIFGSIGSGLAWDAHRRFE